MFSIFYFILLCRDDNERLDSLWSHHQRTSIRNCSQHIMNESLPSYTIRSGKFLYNISIIILLIEESGCECYDQKYIIVSHPEDSPRLLDEILKNIIIRIEEFLK